MTVQPRARPRRIGRLAANLACCVAAAALLSACASKPQLSAQQESNIYRSRAGRNYTPPGPPSDPWGPYINEAAAKFDVPTRWIREVMRQESGGKLYHGGSLVTSGAGAMGLMQVMPATYDEIRGRYPELGDDPYDPHNNILAGTAYIREMYDIYGSPGFLAAYNAGPGRLDDYLTNNRSLPEETRRYVAAIGPRIAGEEPRAPSPGQQYAANAGSFNMPSSSRYASRASAPVRLSPQATPEPAPVQLAAAEPIRLRPQPELAPLPVPIQVATPAAAPYPSAPAGAPFIVLRPQPVEVAEAPEPIQYEAPRPEPVQAAPVRRAPVALAAAREPAPQRPPAYASAPPLANRATQFAQIPEPPRPAPFFSPPRTQQQLAAAALVPLSPRPSGFSLFTPANAAPISLPHSSGGGAWSVQVGAFANEGLASSATLSARDHARDVLGGARSTVSPVREPHGTLYRARLTGLSRDSAAQACERLARARTHCIVVSPDAAS